MTKIKTPCADFLEHQYEKKMNAATPKGITFPRVSFELSDGCESKVMEIKVSVWIDRGFRQSALMTKNEVLALRDWLNEMDL